MSLMKSTQWGDSNSQSRSTWKVMSEVNDEDDTRMTQKSATF
jgi:hypothetical protein